MPVCFSCGSELDGGGKPGRAETCPACDADVHCCRNCEFYETGSYNECREPQAERVLEKDRSNFCDFFDFRKSAAGCTAPGSARPERSNPLDALFKK